MEYLFPEKLVSVHNFSTRMDWTNLQLWTKQQKTSHAIVSLRSLIEFLLTYMNNGVLGDQKLSHFAFHIRYGMLSATN